MAASFFMAQSLTGIPEAVLGDPKLPVRDARRPEDPGMPVGRSRHVRVRRGWQVEGDASNAQRGALLRSPPPLPPPPTRPAATRGGGVSLALPGPWSRHGRPITRLPLPRTLGRSLAFPALGSVLSPSIRGANQLRRGFEKRFGFPFAVRATEDGGPVADSEVDALLAFAWEILDEFNANDVRGAPQISLSSAEGLLALKSSVAVAAQGAFKLDGSLPLLGICAGNFDVAVLALEQWTSALNCDMVLPKSENGAAPENLSAIGPVYIKYNAKSKSCVVVPYFGKFRGVIVQMGQKQVGHLPLNLFDK